MPDPAHIEELNKGVESWNRWRERNNMQPVDLSGANLDQAQLHGCNLIRADLRGASLRGAQLPEAHLKNADFTGACIEQTNFEHANARDACFDNVQGRKARFIVTTLRGASFRNADLERADFYRAYLRQVDFRDANLTEVRFARAFLGRARCDGATLMRADLRGASLVHSSFDHANLRDARVHGVAAWSTSLKQAQQENMLISRTDQEPPVYVDNLNCAHLVSLLVDNEQVRSFMSALSSSMVLILGRFTAERKAVLDLLRARINAAGYAGVVFDFERPSNRDFIEVIKVLAGLSRFVIADLTDPKVVHEEVGVIIDEYPSVPVRAIIEEGQQVSDTLRGHARRDSFVKPLFRYRDSDQIIQELDSRIIEPAERLAQELEVKLRQAIEGL